MNFQDLYIGNTLVFRDGSREILTAWGRDRTYDHLPEKPPEYYLHPIYITTRSITGSSAGSRKLALTESLCVTDGIESPEDVMEIHKAREVIVREVVPPKPTPAMLDQIQRSRAQCTVSVDIAHEWVSIKSLSDPAAEVFLQGSEGEAFIKQAEDLYHTWEIHIEDVNYLVAYDYLDALLP